MPKPFFRKQTQSWYIQIGKKQIPLGKNKREAFAKWRKMQLAEPETDESLKRIFNRYLSWVKANRAATTYTKVRPHLRSFLESVGNIKIGQLKKYHLQQWLDEYPGASETYQHTLAATVITALNWAKDQDRIPNNPLQGFKKPPKAVREFFLTDKQCVEILRSITDLDFREYFLFGILTGARPQETRIVEAKHYDQKNARLILPRTDSKGKKRQRTIYLDDLAKRIVERRCEAHPEGPIFRNTKGRPWTKNSVNCRMRVLKRQFKMPELCAYTLRHTFAHRKLSEGVDSHIVSKLLGHVDGRMLETRYGHIEQNTTLMLKAAQSGQISFPNLDTPPDSTTGSGEDLLA